MRVLPWVVLASMLLAGCSGSEDPMPEEGTTEPTDDSAAGGNGQRIDAPAATKGPVLLADLVVTWRDGSDPFDPAYLAFQTAHPQCMDSDGEPDVWSAVRFALPDSVPNATEALRFTLEWDQTTYIHDEMVIAYKAPERTWRESEYITKGAPLAQPVSYGAEGDPADWEFALCLTRDADDLPLEADSYRTAPANGPVDVTVEALFDHTA